MADYPELKLFIDGEWIAAGARKTQPAINPATGQAIGHLPHATHEDLDRALVAAQRAFLTWRKIASYDRADEIAPILTQEQGKPLGGTKIEIVSFANDLA